MGRPVKKGLKYFNVDCIQEDNLNYVEAKHGITGYGILIKLWRKIYMVDGYYTDWSEKNIYLFAREIGVDVQTVKDVVESCFIEKIFNREMYERFSVLTSHGIQKRYIRIVTDAKRKDCAIIEKFDLLELTQEEKELTPEETPENPGFSTQTKQNKTKEEETKPEETKEEEKLGEKLIVPEMFLIWKKQKPGYPEDRKKDFPALQAIAKFISEKSHIPYNPRDGDVFKKILESWSLISKFVSADDFHKNWSLSQVEKHIQNIIQKIQNGSSKTGSGKQATGGEVDTGSAVSKIARAYAANGDPGKKD
jgi:hypothetical protein